MTEAIRQSVPNTTSNAAGSAASGIGDVLGKVFSDPNVQATVGQAGGSIINGVLGAVGVNTGKTQEQIAAEQAAAVAAEKARNTQMMIIGGAVAVVVVVIVIVVVVKKGKS